MRLKMILLQKWASLCLGHRCFNIPLIIKFASVVPVHYYIFFFISLILFYYYSLDVCFITKDQTDEDLDERVSGKELEREGKE